MCVTKAANGIAVSCMVNFFYSSIEFQNWVSLCMPASSLCICIIHGSKAKYTRKKMELETPIVVEIFKKYMV